MAKILATKIHEDCQPAFDRLDNLTESLGALRLLAGIAKTPEDAELVLCRVHDVLLGAFSDVWRMGHVEAQGEVAHA